MDDAIVIGVFCVGVILVACYGDAWAHFNGLVKKLAQWDQWQLDKPLFFGLILQFAAAVYVIRRIRDTRISLQESEAHRDSLRAANLEIAKSESTLHAQAQTDRLTGLANRICMLNRLESLLASSNRGDGVQAILYMDFDNFKRVNDTFGHEAGDALLREIAIRLRHELRREGDLLARIGGDEFVVLLSNLSEPAEAEGIATRMLDALSQPFQLNASTIKTSVSIGIVILDSQYTVATDALHDADMAMYEAKRLGRGRYVIFDVDVRKHLVRRLRLEQDLRLAIRREELFLVYQPIVSMLSGTLVGVEALARWTHLELGAVSPGEFIPIAEESDLILEIGDWVLRKGCGQMARWIAKFPHRAPAVMSLNVSRKQFGQAELPQRIGGIIRKAGVPPDRIQIEITEDMYIGDTAAAIRAMHELKALGVQLAMDDFGVGATSLSALHQFPIDVLKVDRSLVSDAAHSPDCAAILHSIAVLVRNLDVKLVVEGVETQEQVVALQDLGCKYAQGYFFGKPMTVDQIERRFTQWQIQEVTATGASVFDNSWEHRLPAFQRLEMRETS